ncbi:uncharacterized protein CEXT_602101 [Caerostris extrusa]|uniref:PSI domain-containing protein n=1 Tax=Caerostris extrusa TaxID=172846 RepID=A0AAV4XVA5_CAEEX|nr:uncharacterized protein CEXT_602101 [Caerostris extrusa]
MFKFRRTYLYLSTSSNVISSTGSDVRPVQSATPLQKKEDLEIFIGTSLSYQPVLRTNKIMSHSAFFCGIILSTIFTLTVSASCLHYLSCPCGSSNKNFTHCIDEVPNKENPCEAWANCETCESNITRCITCPQNRRGPICSEVVEGHTRTKKTVSYNGDRYESSISILWLSSLRKSGLGIN